MVCSGGQGTWSIMDNLILQSGIALAEQAIADPVCFSTYSFVLLRPLLGQFVTSV